MSSPSNTNSASPALLRLHVLSLSSLPPHPTLEPVQKANGSNAPPTDLSSFIKQVFSEAVSLIDRDLQDSSLFAFKAKKPSAPSEADVEVLTRTKGNEEWFARRSVHVQGNETGRALWKEFEQGLFKEHSVHEKEYTPDVFDARKVCDWEESLKVVAVEGWHDLGMCVYEMCHHIPTPLYNRTFPTLVVTGKDSAESFVVAQIPVDLTSVPAALYSTGRNRQEGESARQRKKVVLGQYVSVERCKVIKAPGTDDDGKVIWEMATASDAKGSLPMAVQKMALPGAIVKDVGFFMKWIAGIRARVEPMATSGSAAS